MSRETPKVAVLLSTYNGERYLPRQLESLIEQQGVEVDLYVRDDGSSDGTVELLRTYAGRWPLLADLRASPNLGPGHSFLRLLADAPGGYEYYAFCDQDDAWFPSKLARATRVIAAAGEGPVVYCSQFTCADADLNPLRPGPGDSDARFEHQLFENIAWGCTIAMNHRARELIVARLPAHPRIMHDWWCATAISALGRLIYDPEPSLLYRQHGRNAIGLQGDRLKQVWEQARLFFRDPHRFYAVHPQAEELLSIFGDRMAPAQRRRLEALVRSKRSFFRRLAYSLFGPIVRRRPADALVARALVLGGWY